MIILTPKKLMQNMRKKEKNNYVSCLSKKYPLKKYIKSSNEK